MIMIIDALNCNGLLMLYMINLTGKALHDDKEIYGSLLRCFAPPPRRCPFLLP